ncbi:uncharacterized protein LOC144884886 [Branchiostoma floridae x Branchiostoma japonicum]
MAEMHKLNKQYKDLKCYGWMAALLAAGGAAAIIVCGVYIVKPMVETNSLEFQHTTCTTTTSSLTGQWIDCSCGRSCSSSFPCLRMTVTYEGSTNGNASSASVSAVLFDTEQRLNDDGNNAQNRQCVTAPCERNSRDNQREVLRFNETYAPGKNYSCLYHPNARTKVLLKRLFTWDDMFHSMLWSSVGFVIFAIITLYIMGECKKVKDKMRSVQVAAPAVSGAQPGHFLPPPTASGLPPPPAYPGVQSGDSLPMQPAPAPQNLYDTKYSNFSQQQSGLTYS